MSKKKLPAHAHNADVYIGIDSGSIVGAAIWHKRIKTLHLRQFNGHCLALLWSIQMVDGLMEVDPTVKIHFIVEDARLAKKSPHFARAQNAAAKLQGVGYVKAYSLDWQIFLTAKGWSHEMVAPSPALTKWDAEKFERYTGVKTLKTQGHMRDAGMMIWGK